MSHKDKEITELSNRGHREKKSKEEMRNTLQSVISQREQIAEEKESLDRQQKMCLSELEELRSIKQKYEEELGNLKE